MAAQIKGYHSEMARLFGIVSLCLMLSCCSVRYVPFNGEQGYSETQLGPDLFEVTFTGILYTPYETVEDFAMLRAAEMTLARGYSHFEVIERKDRTIERTSTLTTISGSDANGNPTYDFQPYIEKIAAHAITIKPRNGKAAHDEWLVDASRTVHELKRKYKFEN